MTENVCGIEKHTTLKLFAYWNKLRGQRAAPCRLEIEPARISSILPETFILEYKNDQSYTFRLAGTRICQQFGRELRGHDCINIWRREDRQIIKELLDFSAKEGRVGLVKFTGTTDTGRSAKFEMIILPLMHPDQDQSISRFLGSISVNGEAYWLESWPLTELSVDYTESFCVSEGSSNYSSSQFQESVSPDNRYPQKEFKKFESYDESNGVRVVRADQREFRIYEGGLAEN